MYAGVNVFNGNAVFKRVIKAFEGRAVIGRAAVGEHELWRAAVIDIAVVKHRAADGPERDGGIAALVYLGILDRERTSRTR